MHMKKNNIKRIELINYKDTESYMTTRKNGTFGFVFKKPFKIIFPEDYRFRDSHQKESYEDLGVIIT